MLIRIINPNTTSSMTMKIGAAAKIAASPGVEISAVNPSFGPTSIEGYFDEVFSVPGLIEEIGKAAGADAVVIACFDDTGLDAARCATTAPVIGIGEAAFHMASLIAAKFSVVTTLSRSIAPIEHNLARYGLAGCARALVRPKRRARENSPAPALAAAQRAPRDPLKSPILVQPQLIVTAPDRRQPKRRRLTAARAAPLRTRDSVPNRARSRTIVGRVA